MLLFYFCYILSLGLETISYNYGDDLLIRMVRHHDIFFSYAKYKENKTFCSIALASLELESGFPVLVFEVMEDSCAYEEDITDHDEKWAEDAREIMRNKYHAYVVGRRREASQDDRDTLANLDMFGGEEKYIKDKILVNNSKLNCTGISKLATNASLARTAFVAFFGSGNHMMR